MDKKLLDSMFANLLHIGNKTTYVNPKMNDYIYGAVNGIHVMNLTKTITRLEIVKKELEALSKEGKKILFVATKLQSRDAFAKLAKNTGHYYVNEKWVPGLLTNFKTISKRLNYYIKLSSDSEKGAFDVLTKKEKAAKLLELEKLDRVFRGLKEMKKLPDAVFVADGVYDKKSLIEANKIGKKAFAILNTNGNIDLVDDFIPASTNSVKSVTFIAEQLISSLPKAKSGAGTIRKNVVKKTSGEQKRTPKSELKKEIERKAPAKKTENKEVERKAPVRKTEEK